MTISKLAALLTVVALASAGCGIEKPDDEDTSALRDCSPPEIYSARRCADGRTVACTDANGAPIVACRAHLLRGAPGIPYRAVCVAKCEVEIDWSCPECQ